MHPRASLTAAWFGLTTVALGLLATAASAIADLSENTHHQAPWFLRHGVGAGPTSPLWWVLVGLPPLLLWTLGRVVRREHFATVSAVLATLTVLAYAAGLTV
jgi:hypothetical protein